MHFGEKASELLIQSLVLVIGFETVATAPKYVVNSWLVPSTTRRILPASAAAARAAFALRKLDLHNIKQVAFQPVLAAGEPQALE